MKEQGVRMWSKEDWINLLSLQCAFLPNGPDRSRAATTFHHSPQAGDTRTERRDRTGNTFERMTDVKSVGGDPNNPSTTAKYIRLDDTLSISRFWVICRKLKTCQIAGEIAACLHLNFWWVCTAIMPKESTKTQLSFLYLTVLWNTWV